MKSMVKLGALLFVAIAIAGCASSGIKYSDLGASAAATNPDLGRIYLYRTAIVGLAVQPEVRINGEVVGKAVPNGFFYVDKPAGSYEIVTSTEVDRKLSLTLEKGQTRYVKLNISIGFFVGHIYPELADTADAVKDIKDCQYTGQTAQK